jgi:hypothetical protein
MRRRQQSAHKRARPFRAPAFIDDATNNNPRCSNHGGRRVGVYFNAQYKGWRFSLRLIPAGGWACIMAPPLPQPWDPSNREIAAPYFAARAAANPLTAVDEHNYEYGYRERKGSLEDAREWVIGECRKIHAGEDPLALPENMAYLPAVREARAASAPPPTPQTPTEGDDRNYIKMGDDGRAIWSDLFSTVLDTKLTRSSARAAIRFILLAGGSKLTGDFIAANSNREGGANVG